MIESGKVIKVLPDKKIEVEIIRTEGCQSCKGCIVGAGGEVVCPRVIVENTKNNKEGDKVLLQIDSKNFYLAFSLIFVIPLLVFIGSAVILMSFAISQGISFIYSSSSKSKSSKRASS